MNIADASGQSQRWFIKAYNITSTGFTMVVNSPNDQSASFGAWSSVKVQWVAVA
jgi:hypothetical protein